MPPVICVRCGDENGPWERKPDGPVCETCLDKDGAQ